MKPSPDILSREFFKEAHDEDLNSTFYSARYMCPIKEKHVRKIVHMYHPHARDLAMSDVEDSQQSTGSN